MAIAFGTLGTMSAGGTTTVDIPHPASVAANDLLLAGRVMWLSSATPTAEAGWTSGGDRTGGTGSADDAHTSRVRADYRIAAGGETGNVTFDQGATPSGAVGQMLRYTKAADKDWFVTSPFANMGAVEAAYAGRTMAQIEGYLNGQGGLWRWGNGYTTGTDDSHAANRSITSSQSIHLQIGDMIVVVVAVDTDAAMTVTSPAITASGFTFGTTNRRTSGAGVTTGNDGNIEIFDALVTAGSTTTIPLTLAFTTATTQCGPAVFVRLREVAKTSSFPQSAPVRRVLSSMLAG